MAVTREMLTPIVRDLRIKLEEEEKKAVSVNTYNKQKSKLLLEQAELNEYGDTNKHTTLQIKYLLKKNSHIELDIIKFQTLLDNISNEQDDAISETESLLNNIITERKRIQEEVDLLNKAIDEVNKDINEKDQEYNEFVLQSTKEQKEKNLYLDKINAEITYKLSLCAKSF